LARLHSESLRRRASRRFSCCRARSAQRPAQGPLRGCRAPSFHGFQGVLASCLHCFSMCLRLGGARDWCAGSLGPVAGTRMCPCTHAHAAGPLPWASRRRNHLQPSACLRARTRGPCICVCAGRAHAAQRTHAQPASRRARAGIRALPNARLGCYAARGGTSRGARAALAGRERDGAARACGGRVRARGCFRLCPVCGSAGWRRRGCASGGGESFVRSGRRAGVEALVAHGTAARCEARRKDSMAVCMDRSCG